MKNFLLFISIFLCYFSSKAQTLNVSPTTITSGGSVKVTGNGESTIGYYSAVFLSGLPLSSGSGTVTGVISNLATFNKSTFAPTSFDLKLTSTSSSPVTVFITLTVTINNDIAMTSRQQPQNVTQVVTINPATSTGGGTGTGTGTGTGGTGTAPVFPSNGSFVRNDNTGQVGIVIEGILRYIPTSATLYGLFDFNENILKHYTTAQLTSLNVPVGTAFTSDNGLINDTLTGRVYLREGNTLRWIYTPTIFSRYRFNTHAIQNDYDVERPFSPYTVGTTINN